MKIQQLMFMNHVHNEKYMEFACILLSFFFLQLYDGSVDFAHCQLYSGNKDYSLHVDYFFNLKLGKSLFHGISRQCSFYCARSRLLQLCGVLVPLFVTELMG